MKLGPLFDCSKLVAAEVFEKLSNWLVLKLLQAVAVLFPGTTLEMNNFVSIDDVEDVVEPGTSTTTILVVSTDPSELVKVVSLVVVITSGISGSSVMVDNTSELLLVLDPVSEEVLTGELFEMLLVATELPRLDVVLTSTLSLEIAGVALTETMLSLFVDEASDVLSVV